MQGGKNCEVEAGDYGFQIMVPFLLFKELSGIEYDGEMMQR